VLAVAVLQEYWGRGIATQMFDQVIRWSRGAGVGRLELTVHTSNLRALSLYLRCGFVVEGIRRNSLLVRGEYVDEYAMARIE
jgi:RimJ/RimL family protein N-acetyltransferase